MTPSNTHPSETHPPPPHPTHDSPPRELTRLNPKVTDIVFVATFKLILKPLVKKIPGFGERAAGLVSEGGGREAMCFRHV